MLAKANCRQLNTPGTGNIDPANTAIFSFDPELACRQVCLPYGKPSVKVETGGLAQASKPLQPAAKVLLNVENMARDL